MHGLLVRMAVCIFLRGALGKKAQLCVCGLLKEDNRVQQDTHCLWTLPSGNGLLTFTINWLKWVTLLFLSSQGTGKYDSFICSEVDEAAVTTTVTQLLVEIVSKAKKT